MDVDKVREREFVRVLSVLKLSVLAWRHAHRYCRQTVTLAYPPQLLMLMNYSKHPQ